MNRGVTVVELLIVVVVLILIGGLIRLHFVRKQEEEKRVEVQTDLKKVAQEIDHLHQDTGLDPSGIDREPCVQGAEVFLNTCRAGLKCTDGSFSDWDGPYMKELPKDPWGQHYYFNADYLCKKETSGCKSVPNTTKVRAILSAGPDGNPDTNEDNIVHIICK